MPAPWAYFDTSVFVKRYVREPGSARARVLLRRYRFLTSAITPVEAISALCRRRAAGELTARSFAAILSRLRRDRAYWELVEVSPLVLNEAEALIQEVDRLGPERRSGERRSGQTLKSQQFAFYGEPFSFKAADRMGGPSWHWSPWVFRPIL